MLHPISYLGKYRAMLRIVSFQNIIGMYVTG